MFVQTEVTPNPNSLKFLPGRVVSKQGSFEITKEDETSNNFIKELLSVNGVKGVYLGKDFISINKNEASSWDEIKSISDLLLMLENSLRVLYYKRTTLSTLGQVMLPVSFLIYHRT